MWIRDDNTFLVVEQGNHSARFSKIGVCKKPTNRTNRPSRCQIFGSVRFWFHFLEIEIFGFSFDFGAGFFHLKYIYIYKTEQWLSGILLCGLASDPKFEPSHGGLCFFCYLIF